MARGGFGRPEQQLANPRPTLTYSGRKMVWTFGSTFLFVDGRKRKARDGEVEKEALYEEIGRLKVELDWLKKKAGLLE